MLMNLFEIFMVIFMLIIATVFISVILGHLLLFFFNMILLL